MYNWLAQFGRSVQRLVLNIGLILIVIGLFTEVGIWPGIVGLGALLWYWGFGAWQNTEEERTGTRPPFFRHAAPEWWEDGPDRQYQDVV